MKTARKLLSLLLALCMVFTLSCAALADDAAPIMPEGGAPEGMPAMPEGGAPGGMPEGGMPPEGGAPGGPGGDMNLGAEGGASAIEEVLYPAPAFTDFDSVRNQDAVSALTALGVVGGNPAPDGSLYYAPTAGLTRAEMAKLIAGCLTLIRGEIPEKAVSDFSDVGSHWAAAYIDFCRSQGVVNGVSDSSYAPESGVTALETAKLLLAAMGNSTLTGDGWAEATGAAADALGLFEGVDCAPEAAICRDDAARLIWNALLASDGSALLPAVSYGESVNVSEGVKEISNAYIYYKGGSAIQDSGSSSVIVRDSYIEGDTDAETVPLAGNPGNLLVAGTIRTTLALGQSHAYYLNSAVVSKNWAALSTDGAEPALNDGEEELSLFTYGSDAVTYDGGYGAYSDLFCNLNVYGSAIECAEIGVISGTYGRVNVGTIADGELDPSLSAVLTDSDKAAQSDKALGSSVTGGRNAIMIHSVNLPPYWAYEGYSQAELPLYSTEISVKNSALTTDMSLDKNVAYDAQKQAFIKHSAGSVILIKSTNADISLDHASLIADPAGTGAVIHTVYNNDTMFMNAVPDGESYPGVKVSMLGMDVTGDIIAEDYQRDVYITLDATALTGACFDYDCAHWNAVAAAEGFTDYALDESYAAAHGVELSLTNGSKWTVTAESSLSRLTIDETSSVVGSMTIDGAAAELKPGTYEGAIVLTPAA